MVQLIKKGGLRERANRSRYYQGSENTETSLKPNAYSDLKKQSLSPQQDPTEDLAAKQAAEQTATSPSK